MKCSGGEKRGRREGLHFEGSLQVRNDKQSRQVTLLLALTGPLDRKFVKCFTMAQNHFQKKIFYARAFWGSLMISGPLRPAQGEEKWR